MMYKLPLTWLLVAFTISIGGQARATIQDRSPARVNGRVNCRTNAECIQKGLPLISPGHRISRRQFIPVTILETTQCGLANQEQILLPGTYTFTLGGAQGGENRQVQGGVGATLTARVNISSVPTTVGYFVGCQGTSPFEVGGGGGGTFVFITGTGAPALLVAGGGGGASYSLDNTPPTAGGTDVSGLGGSQGGQSGITPGGTGGGGAGFEQAGFSFSDADIQAGGGGSQSVNFGGTFSGGQIDSKDGDEINGGAGGGGGSGFNGGGGGGGYSGGQGGFGGNEEEGNAQDQIGGSGGTSYLNPNPPTGLLLTLIEITATRSGDGSLVITQIA